jgi:sorbitol/mannitol transport system substrate-binding protein
MITLSHMASQRRGALRRRLIASAVAGIGLGLGSTAYATTVTIAVPNNNDLI